VTEFFGNFFGGENKNRQLFSSYEYMLKPQLFVRVTICLQSFCFMGYQLQVLWSAINVCSSVIRGLDKRFSLFSY